MDKEVEIKNQTKKATLRSLQSQVEAIVYQERKHATTQCELRRVGRKRIRTHAQPQVIPDSEDDCESEGVSPFDIQDETPAFKKARNV